MSNYLDDPKTETDLLKRRIYATLVDLFERLSPAELNTVGEFSTLDVIDVVFDASAQVATGD